MKALISHEFVDLLKQAVEQLFPDAPPMRRAEAIAHGLGWERGSSAMQKALAVSPEERDIDDRAFSCYLAKHGFACPSGTFSEAVTMAVASATERANQLRVDTTIKWTGPGFPSMGFLLGTRGPDNDALLKAINGDNPMPEPQPGDRWYDVHQRMQEMDRQRRRAERLCYLRHKRHFDEMWSAERKRWVSKEK